MKSTTKTTASRKRRNSTTTTNKPTNDIIPFSTATASPPSQRPKPNPKTTPITSPFTSNSKPRTTTKATKSLPKTQFTPIFPQPSARLRSKGQSAVHVPSVSSGSQDPSKADPTGEPPHSIEIDLETSNATPSASSHGDSDDVDVSEGELSKGSEAETKERGPSSPTLIVHLEGFSDTESDTPTAEIMKKLDEEKVILHLKGLGLDGSILKNSIAYQDCSFQAGRVYEPSW